MSIYDTLAPAVDTQNLQAGMNPLETIAAGASAATISGLGSIYNTFASGANYLGGDVALLDTEKTLEGIDRSWADLYRDNKTALDVTGFVATSMIPGFAGVKALNLARSGQGVGAVGRALGYAQSQQARYLGQALEEMAVQGGTVFTNINKNKLLAMTWGGAEQALQAAAFETAVALTMKESPLLADSSWWDITKAGTVNALFGGVLGGGIDALVLQSSLKNAVKTLDKRSTLYSHLTNLENTGALTGDKAYGIIDSVLALPDSVLADDKIASLAFHISRPEKIPGFNPAIGRVDLDISRFLGRTLDASQRSGLLKFEEAIGKLSEGSSDVGQAFATKILSDFKVMKDSNVPQEQIRERIGDYLLGLQKISPANREATYAAEDLWYFKKTLTPEELKTAGSVGQLEKLVASNTPFKESAYGRPFVFTGTPEQRAQAFSTAARIGAGEGDNVFPSLRAAWDSGAAVAIREDGTLRINPRSRLWRPATDLATDSKQFLNLRTGAFTDNAVLTAADRVAAGKAMTVDSGGVTIPLPAARPGQPGTTLLLKMATHFDDEADATYFTARHAWASKLTDSQLPDQIRIDDFSLMDRLRSVATPERLEAIELLRPDGESVGMASEFALSNYINQAKLSKAEELFGKSYDEGKFWDMRDLAYRLNSSQEWLESAVAKKFANNEQILPSGEQIPTGPLEHVSMPLESYLQRETVRVEYKTPAQFVDLQQITPAMTAKEKRDVILATANTNGGQFLTGELAWKYRVQQATEANKNAASAVLGSDRWSQLPALDQNASQLASSNGVGASLVGSSNAGYGDTLELAMQTSGKLTHIWIKEDVSAMMEKMGPLSLALQRNQRAAAEVGVVTNLLRGTDQKFIWHPTEDGVMINSKLRGVAPEDLPSKMAELEANGQRVRVALKEQDAIAFFKGHAEINSGRVQKRQVLYNARGVTTSFMPDTIYVPPVDTTYFKHFAFVRPIEGRAFGTSEVAMVFGRDADELAKRIALVDPKNFQVVTKRGTEEWFKAKDLYDFNLTINEPRINSELRKSGALSDVFPEVRAGNVVEDYLRWHQNQTSRLVRDSVETNYAQQFAELRDLGRSYTEVATSRFAGSTKLTSSEVANPFDDYIKTGLDISKRSEYTFLHQANEFVDALGVRAWQAVDSVFGQAKKGLLNYQEVNQVMEQHGIRGIYESQEQLFTANVPRDRNLFRETISRANALLANTLLRLDFFNSILNTVSTPLLLSTELASIRTMAARDPELLGKLNEALRVTVPDGSGASVPSTTKLLAKAVENFFSDGKAALIQRYERNGDIRSTLAQFHDMLDSIALRPDFKNFSDGVTAAFEKGAKFTLNEQAEQFTRFVSADVMRQLTEPAVQKGVLSLAEQNSFISVFVNRVQGNYITSQRPIAFQGVLGSAVSLFQTYSFNLMQQLLRHVGNRDKRAVAQLFGMQAGLFGLNSLPFFEAVNTHLIGNSAVNQREHHDAYSVVPRLLGKELGDWLMYGTASAMPLVMNGQTPALYSRGDINPRNLTVLPLNPLDWPFISASTKVAQNLANVGQKLVAGADVSETLLQGLEHNGLNRPLAGMAQVFQGQSTTSKGSVISASSDFNLITSASRILGSRPMDEAVALNHLYRMNAYRTAQQERMELLGEGVKSYLYNNQAVPADVLMGFQRDYAKIGGNVSEFNGALQRWGKNANVSAVEDMRRKVNTPMGRRLNEIMGGVPLPDWRNAPLEVTQPDASQLPEPE